MYCYHYREKKVGSKERWVKNAIVWNVEENEMKLKVLFG